MAELDPSTQYVEAMKAAEAARAAEARLRAEGTNVATPAENEEAADAAEDAAEGGAHLDPDADFDPETSEALEIDPQAKDRADAPEEPAEGDAEAGLDNGGMMEAHGDMPAASEADASDSDDADSSGENMTDVGSADGTEVHDAGLQA